jgi:hypothetical protein
MQQPRVSHAAIFPGQVNLGWRGARGRGRRGGRSRWCRNALDAIGLRDDAQDAQRVPTSRALRNVHREDPQQRKAERLDDGLGCINQVLIFGFRFPARDFFSKARRHVATASTNSCSSVRATCAPRFARISRTITRNETIRVWPASSSCRRPTSTGPDRSYAGRASAGFSASSARVDAGRGRRASSGRRASASGRPVCAGASGHWWAYQPSCFQA